MATTIGKLFRTFLLCVLIMARGATALAQGATPTVSFNVNVGDQVWVTTVDGNTTKVVVAGINAQGLEIFARGKRINLGAAEITRLEERYRDPLRNGLIGGGVVGAATGALLAFSFTGDPGFGSQHAGFFIGLAAAEFGTAGILIGGIGDALIHGKREVYHARLTLRPAVTKRAAGAMLTLRW